MMIISKKAINKNILNLLITQLININLEIFLFKK